MKKKILFKFISPFILVCLLSGNIQIATAGYYNPPVNPRATPYFNIINPWSSSRSFVAGTSGGAIPGLFYNGFSEFMSWYATVYSNASDHWPAFWKELTGNSCEIIKIQSLESREQKYLLARRNITIGGYESVLVDDESELRVEDAILNSQELYDANLKKMLTQFMTLEFAKMKSDAGGYSLLGTSGTVDCEGSDPCEGQTDGEYCLGNNSRVTNQKLRNLSFEAKNDIINLYCTYHPNIGDAIDSTGLTETRNSILDYIDTVINFYSRATADVEIPNIDVDLAYNKTTDETGDAISYLEEKARSLKKSCLTAANITKFAKVNYDQSCGCPSLQFSWFDIKGLIEELVITLKNLSTLRESINNILDTIEAIRGDDSNNAEGGFWSRLGDSPLGEWWGGLNDEAAKEAREAFKKKFGYYPEKSSGNPLDTFRRFFDRLFSGEFVKARFDLTNRPIEAVPTLRQILSDHEGSVPSAELLREQSEKEKEHQRQIRTASRGFQTIDLVMYVNSLREVGYELRKAGAVLSTASCEETRKSVAYDAVIAELEGELENSQSDSDADRIVKQINSFETINSYTNVLDRVFSDENSSRDACKEMDTIRHNIGILSSD